MPEASGVNIEVAHELGESYSRSEEPSNGHEIIEIIEAVILALVAVSTAWGGYQAALWDSHQSRLYGQSTKLRIEAQGLEVRSNQERQYNASTVAEWLGAEAHGEHELAALFERRFLPEFAPAFQAWKKTDPIHNPSAPAGPMLMPEYHNMKAEEAARMNQRASEIFEQGTKAREWADQYVRMTVMLATVLLLTAISQRFRRRSIRVALVVLAFLLLCFPVWHMITLPRA